MVKLVVQMYLDANISKTVRDSIGQTPCSLNTESVLGRQNLSFYQFISTLLFYSLIVYDVHSARRYDVGAHRNISSV